MQLEHIDIGKLKISALNMRHGKKVPDISDILPSVRARGILQPLLVRPDGEDYEIIAGRRRYFAAKAVKEEQGDVEPLPCAIMEPGDDAGALEASLIENVARLDPDEVSQWEIFVRLTKEGKSASEIAATFGLTERMVKGKLALGNLLPKIREAYRNEEIDAETIRHLTMASKAQQKDWLALYEDPKAHAPQGHQLKQWVFGGASISTKVALFPLEDYAGQIVSDLFGEESYFADADLFWQRQNEAIAAKRASYLDAGWSAVEILEVGQRFQSWDHEKMPKKKGGKVFITVAQRGEVECYEGWLSRKEARRAGKRPDRTGEGYEVSGTVEPSRPAMTQSMQTYLELHRHAAVRLALLAHPAAALRLLIAHAVAASGHWQVKPEPQQARREDIAASIAGSPAQQAFAAERKAIMALLALPEGGDAAHFSHGGDDHTAVIFARLLGLSDEEVLRVAAFTMAETLAAGSAVVEAAGVFLGVDPRNSWQADETFFELVRDKATVNAMLTEVAGKAVADANLTERAKTQKQVIRDYVTGENGRTKIEHWLPGWMAFPFRAYREGACVISAQTARIAGLFPTG